MLYEVITIGNQAVPIVLDGVMYLPFEKYVAAVDIIDNVRVDRRVMTACVAAGGFRYTAVPWEVGCRMAAMSYNFV